MKNVIIHGRYQESSGKIKLFNTASGISLLVKGSISIDISFEKKPGYFYVIKDFDYENKTKCFVKDNETITINFDDKKPHHIDLVKANEAMDNFLVINKIRGELLENQNRQNKFIKVYGDSTIAGYGILAKTGEPDIDTNDGVVDFCYRAIYSLNYDYDIFAASGWGLIFSSYTSPKEIGINRYMDALCVCSNEKFKTKTPDLLIISLGTNDNAYIEENKDKKEELIKVFIDSYEKLILKERENSSNLPVLMVYGSLKEENVYPLIEKTYEELTKKYSNIYIVKLSGDNSGLSNHSYLSYHEKMAEELKEKIKGILH